MTNIIYSFIFILFSCVCFIYLLLSTGWCSGATAQGHIGAGNDIVRSPGQRVQVYQDDGGENNARVNAVTISFWSRMNDKNDVH